MKTLNLIQASALLFLITACGDENGPSSDPLFVLADAETNDAADSGLTGPADEPRAQIYLNDPVTDREQLTEVTLHRPTDETGLLTSEWVQVFNCLNNDGGPTAMPMGFPFSIQFCCCILPG